MTMIYKYQINGTIRVADDDEALGLLNFFKDSYAANINQLQIQGTYSFDNEERFKPVQFGMVFTDYTEMLAAVVAIKTGYGLTPNISLNVSEAPPAP